MPVLDIAYQPPGPVAAAFHYSNAFVRGLMGPVGSGKTVSCIWEVFTRGCEQEPSADGVRKTRWAIVRNTYPELKTTTIKTWQDWFREDVFGPIVWGAPISHHLKFETPEHGKVDIEIWFIALDQPKHVKKLLSMELTGAYINEAREVPKAILDGLTQRVGRYPGKIEGCSITWSGVIMDTNPPEDDHWWYTLAEDETPEGYKFFRQPGAMILYEGEYYPNKKAENVHNQQLGFDYWRRQIAGKRQDWINVYILGLYGTVADGKPVYPEYNDNIHCAKRDLVPIKGLPLMLGWDFGLTPTVVISQLTSRGQWRILDELIADRMGIKQFLASTVRPYLSKNYAGFEIEEGTGDPAGKAGSDADENTPYAELEKAELPAEPAPTNNFIPRRDAVADFLTRLIDGEPAFQLSPKCKTLRKGFIGRYKLKRVQVSGQERYKDEPDKDDFSHPQDAAQYTALRILAGMPKQRHKMPAIKKAQKRHY